MEESIERNRRCKLATAKVKRERDSRKNVLIQDFLQLLKLGAWWYTFAFCTVMLVLVLPTFSLWRNDAHGSCVASTVMTFRRDVPATNAGKESLALWTFEPSDPNGLFKGSHFCWMSALATSLFVAPILCSPPLDVVAFGSFAASTTLVLLNPS